MLTINAAEQIVWKRSLREALLDLDPKSFGKKLEAAREAIHARLLELRPTANSDSVEVHELLDGLHTICAIEFLKER
jgi:hypothetical protein